MNRGGRWRRRERAPETVALRRQDGGVACDRCRIASRTPARMRGLLGRRKLDAGEGMLIRPAPSIHTFFMLFSIDVVFLRRDGTVLKVRENVRPWRVAGCRGAHGVLELAAGETRRRSIRRGDRLERVDGAGS